MRTKFKGLLLAVVLVFLAPPPDASAGTTEEELQLLDQKIQSGQATPADIQTYNNLLQVLQDEQRKQPKNELLKPTFRLVAGGLGEQGFTAASAATDPAPTCGEFKNIYYDCSVLPWDATDAWTRTGVDGNVTVRSCTSADACVSDGVLVIQSQAAPLFYRVEEGLVTERYASASFRMRQTISNQKPPEPGGAYWGAGLVWIDDGVKGTAVGFAEDYSGQQIVIMPIVGHPNPQTGELGIEQVLTAYHDWSAWHEYRLVKDAQGMIALFVDGDTTPVLSYPYASLDMGTLGAPVVLFGQAIDGENSTVTSEYDYINYSVGMPNNDGCTSGDGIINLQYVVDENVVFNPYYDVNQIVALARIVPVEGLASNTQSHRFYLRADRRVLDASGNVVRNSRDERLIGPLGPGQNPNYLLANAISYWDGRNAAGEMVQSGSYSYLLNLSVVRVDKKGKEKTVSTIPVAGAQLVTTTQNTGRIYKDTDARKTPKFYVFYDYVTKNTNYSYKVINCSTGSIPIIDVLYNANPNTNWYKDVSTGAMTGLADGCYWASVNGTLQQTCVNQSVPQVDIKPATTNWIMGIIRAWNNNTGGTGCTLSRKIGNASWGNIASGISFASTRIDWTWQAGDEMQSVLLESGGDTLILLAAGTNEGMIRVGTWPAYDDNSGVGLASKVSTGDSMSGTVYIGQKPAATGYKINVYRNDVYQDDDHDGLGNELENALGTCKDDKSTTVTKFGFHCDNALEGGKDTDGDGLRDGWEVFGVPAGFGGAKSDELPLTEYGSDPLHKDVFIEVDYWSFPGDPALNLPPHDHRLRPNVIAAIERFFRNGPVTNPDGTSGIEIHILNDQATGCDADVCPGDPVELTDLCCGKKAPCRVAEEDIYVHRITKNRRGVFRLVISYHGCHGGTTRYTPGHVAAIGNCFSNNVPCPVRCGGPLCDECNTVASPCGGDDYFWQYASFIHEVGHTLGLQHGGGDDINDKPNYPSMMNYSYEWDFLGSPQTLSGTRIQYSPGRYRDLPVAGGLDENHLCEQFGLGTNNDNDIKFMSIQFPGFHIGQSNLCGSSSCGYVPGAIDWDGDLHFEDQCVANPGVGGGVQADINHNGVPGERLNDWNDWDVIVKKMKGGLYGEQCARFDGDYCGRPVPILLMNYICPGR